MRCASKANTPLLRPREGQSERFSIFDKKAPKRRIYAESVQFTVFANRYAGAEGHAVNIIIQTLHRRPLPAGPRNFTCRADAAKVRGNARAHVISGLVTPRCIPLKSPAAFSRGAARRQSASAPTTAGIQSRFQITHHARET